MNGKIEVERTGNILRIGEETRDVSYFANANLMRWRSDDKSCEINSLRGFFFSTKLYRREGISESQCSELFSDIMKKVREE